MNMNKLKSIALFVLLPLAVITGITAAALAQDFTAPAPYAGAKNPNGWTDANAIKAGKSVYLKSCFSCHGANGGDVAQADFSTPEFAAELEAHPDFFFYVVSEGIKDTEMAGYKFTVTEAQRWQALTYIHSLGYVPPKPNGGGPVVTPNATDNATTNQTPNNGSGAVVPPTSGPVEPEPPPPPVILAMHIPAQAKAGEPLHITFNLTQGNETIADAPITVFFKLTYFTAAPQLATIGQATTDENGTAEITYTPKTTGYIPVIARYTPEGEKPIEAASTLELTAEVPLYETNVGLEYKGFPPDITLFPSTVWEGRAPGIAPVNVIRIPGGLPFIPFAAYLGVVCLVWGLYVFVGYQIFRVVPNTKVKGINLKLFPMAIMAVLAGAGLTMVLILITGPYSGHVILP
jgi:mono/diheme cytochrome c family protein